MVNRSAKEVGRRHEVGVEHRDELAAGRVHCRSQRTGLESLPVRAMHVLDVEPPLGQPAAAPSGQGRSLVGRVVQDLDLQSIPRIVEAAGGLDHALDHGRLVEHRQLDRDRRKAAKLVGSRAIRGQVAIPQIDEHDPVAVGPVDAKHQDHRRVIRQQWEGQSVHRFSLSPLRPEAEAASAGRPRARRIVPGIRSPATGCTCAASKGPVGRWTLALPGTGEVPATRFDHMVEVIVRGVPETRGPALPST